MTPTAERQWREIVARQQPPIKVRFRTEEEKERFDRTMADLQALLARQTTEILTLRAELSMLRARVSTNQPSKEP
jgi:hypothetical protein